MKNNKGLTLVELMAVLVIMALLMTLAFPNVSELTNKAKSNYDRTTQILIKSAAKMYVSNNIQEIETALQNSNTHSYCLPIGKLIAYEYLDADLKNLDNQSINHKKCIIITKNNEAYQYNLDSSQEDDGDFLPPVITITGDGCSSTMSVNSYTVFDSSCTVKASDNIDSTKTFKPIKEKETDNKLSKVVIQEDDKIFIKYNATDTSGNKSIPLQVQLTITE